MDNLKKVSLKLAYVQMLRKQMSLKTGITDSTKLCIVVPVLMALTFIHGHSVTRKLEVLQLFFCQVA